MNKIFIILSVLFCAASCCDSQKTDGQVVWVEEFPSVWSATLGEPEQFNLLNATGVAPRSEVLSGGNAASLPFDQSKIKYTVHNSRTCITISISADEQIYGLGLNFKSLSQRGAIKQLHMDHYSNSDNGRTHAPVPFFVSSQGYGILFNSARYIDAWVTSAVRTDSENPPVATDRTTNPHWSAQPYSDNMEILIPADGVELVLFSGETMMDVVASFNLYTGGGFIPPKWGLGFWQRTPTAFSDGDALEEADSFVEHDFPLDVIGLEPGWHSYAYPCSFEWDSVRFANAPEFVEQMQQRNIKVNLWANPYLSPESSLFEPMNQYVGSHTVWCGTVPDYTMPQAQKLFQDHITKHQLQMGVSGYKIDEVDGYDCWLWPDVATFPSGLDGEQMRSVYGNLVMKTILDSYRAQNQRTYGMVRGVNAGGSSFPFVIYNDNYSHQDFITAISSASFIGVQWTPEVRASGSSQEWLRRMQTTCFSPLALINAWADGTKPWSFPDVYEQCQEVAKLRMQLLPYLYSSFAQYYLTGVPVFRAMNLVEGYSSEVKRIKTKLDGTDNPYEMAKYYEIKDQYMMGDNILVAPIFAGQTQRNVVLPKGKWYDFYSGELVGEDQVITIEAPEDRIPLYVRDGGIIPMIPQINNTQQWVAGQPLQVRIYGSRESTFDLYDDDGESFDYEKGEYTIKRLSTQKSITDIATRGEWSYTDVQWVEM